MIHNLDFNQLKILLQSVFDLKADETWLTVLVDLPDNKVADNARWYDRRKIADEWYNTLSENIKKLPFRVINLCSYENVGTNNNDLPTTVTLAQTTLETDTAALGERINLSHVLRSSSVVLALTELSATAPLKNHAKQCSFRGATLPGFTREMFPALSLDYEKVHNRVMQFKSRLDRAVAADIAFMADGKRHNIKLDLRYRPAHVSGGLIRENGLVANLPSGEAYIVPYEGEQTSDPSQTTGTLPVQFGDEIVVYRLEQNRAVEVLSSGSSSEYEREKLLSEPAYGNIAELGLGVLGEWGVTAVGRILLDEKLGLHIAFGRSEHFGGITGPGAFHSPANVIHIDRVYVPFSQPRIEVDKVVLTYELGEPEIIMRQGKYIV